MANRESIPPPPYSETDIVSNSNIVLTPATSQADDFSVAGQGYPSTTSSNESIKIYTPGASPPPSEYHPSGQDNNHSVSDGFMSASVFFESRPLQSPILREPLKNYTISINPSTVPNDLPYPEDLLARNITHLDWATFINYLLPTHTITSNHDVADRKIRAEFLDEELEDLSLNEKSSKIIDPVLAQLEPLRSPISPVSPNSTTISMTIEEWNESFFEPRGVRIIANQNRENSPSEQPRDMPGTWIPYDHELLPQQPESSASASSKPKQTRRGMLSGFLPGVVEANSKGFRMGPIVADSDGFRIGRGLVADNNGFKIGNMLIADNKGFRLGGARGFAADSNGVTIGSRSFGRRESHDEQARAGGRGRRGRRQCHPEPQNTNRGRSLSTSSSSSHASSSDSVSSVGSLPEYEDLREGQLPVARLAIKNWLDHPDIPITKETVAGIKQEIRESKRGGIEQHHEDIATLKKEVKEMMRTFKERKRSEKRERRARKREKRATRRAAKRERRTVKREERRARREERREGNISPLQQHPPSIPSPNHGISMPILPSNIPVPTIMRGFPYLRTASAPSISKDINPSHTQAPPGISALHGAWPFTQGRPYAPGNISVPNFNSQDPTPVLRSAEQIQEQLMEIEKLADEREASAVDLYISGSVESIDDAERKRIINEATALEEEASVYRREADRLRAEGQHLDSELARELEESDNVHVEHGGQVSGVIRQ